MLFRHSPSEEYQVSSYAPSILCKKRKDRSVAERIVYDQAVKGYHNTRDGAKLGLQRQPCLGSPMLGTTSCSLGYGCAAQRSTELKALKESTRRATDKMPCSRSHLLLPSSAKCPRPWVLSALKCICPKVLVHLRDCSQ